ncbi:uncharacterized protein CLUP02_13863 [Colletotrichum lupini]|uniref:Uncharacterized protein n=1 Tax=Colletotrichum lupini TaxID=145971 RepID=A0A9Q8WMR3_9PEZI|nr:uncharacterized protein CLUP02_13863 [Colletotrichum lupini]UQC88340.1 hypothetical protein CLUP02_13863 [Colletotrichum lupini]
MTTLGSVRGHKARVTRSTNLVARYQQVITPTASGAMPSWALVFLTPPKRLESVEPFMHHWQRQDPLTCLLRSNVYNLLQRDKAQGLGAARNAPHELVLVADAATFPRDGGCSVTSRCAILWIFFSKVLCENGLGLVFDSGQSIAKEPCAITRFLPAFRPAAFLRIFPRRVPSFFNFASSSCILSLYNSRFGDCEVLLNMAERFHT